MRPFIFCLILFAPMYGISQVSPCANAIPLSCGQTMFRNTNNMSDKFNSGHYSLCYNNVHDYHGKDIVFEFSTNSFRNIHFNLELFDDVEMDLFLFSVCAGLGVVEPTGYTECATTTFVDYHTGHFKRSIDFAASPGTYYIVVDGRDAEQNGSFELTMDCECECNENFNLAVAAKAHTEDFEFFDWNGISFQSNVWRKWNSEAGDGAVQYEDHNQHLRIRKQIESNIIYKLTDLQPQRLRLSFSIFVEEGKWGYFHLLNRLPDNGGSNPEYLSEVVFVPDGTGQLYINSNLRTTFSYQQESWTDIMQIVDPDNNIIELWINHEFIARWTFSESVNPPFSLKGLNFIAKQGADFKVDNLCVWRRTNGQIPLPVDPVCVDNGTQYQSDFVADDALFAPDEYGKCLSVCDYGGEFIYRSDQIIGTIDPDDNIPGSLLSENCILEFYGGNIPENIGAEIKIFYNDDNNLLLPTPTMGSPEIFVFQCEVDTVLNESFQVYVGKIGGDTICGLDQSEIVEGIYYLVVFAEIGVNYGFSVFPEGDCKTFLDIDCGVIDTSQLSSENQFDFDTLGDYATCYNGINAYKGNDQVYRFTIDDPSIVNITLQSDDQKGIFLYDFLCGRNCLDYAETSLTGGSAVITDVKLNRGRYYLIVDSQEGNVDVSVVLSVSCIPDEDYYSVLFEEGDLDCPVEAQQAQIHEVRVPANLSEFIKPGAYVNAGFIEGEDQHFVYSREWDQGDIILFSLPQDSLGDGDKCAYLPGDSILLSVLSPSIGGDHVYVPLTVNYSELNGTVITAKGLFENEGKSYANALSSLDQHPIELTPPFKQFSSIANASKFFVKTNVAFTVEEFPPADWYAITSQPYKSEVTFTISPNPSQLVREGDFLIRYRTNPPFERKFHISQNGTCIKPEVQFVSGQPNHTFCTGEQINLTADVVNGLDSFFIFNWDNGATSQTLSFVAEQNTSFVVTVTESSCFAADTFSVDVFVNPVPSVDAGADEAICPGDSVMIGTENNPAYQYVWGSGETTSSIFVSPNGLETYILQASLDNCFDWDTIVVYVFDTTTWTISEDVSITCHGDADGQLTVTALDGSFPQSVQWSNNSQTTVNSNLAAGTYEVTVTDMNGCIQESSYTLTESTEEITYVITVTHPTFGMNQGEISVQVTGGTRPYTFRWTDSGGNPVTGDSIVTNLGAGCYSVTIEDSRHCVLDISCIELIVSVLNIGSGKLTAFPNPTEGIINLFWTNLPFTEFEWEITTLAGQNIGSGKCQGASGHLEIEELRRYPPGTYLLTLTSGFNHYPQKIIVH